MFGANKLQSNIFVDRLFVFMVFSFLLDIISYHQCSADEVTSVALMNHAGQLHCVSGYISTITLAYILTSWIKNPWLYPARTLGTPELPLDGVPLGLSGTAGGDGTLPGEACKRGEGQQRW